MKKQNKNNHNRSCKGRFGEKNISQNCKCNIYLPNDLKMALYKLKIDQPGYSEQKNFFVYLSFATNNIFEIAGISHDFSTDGIKVWDEIKRLKMVDKLARFLWLFRIKDPAKECPDYEEITEGIVKKLLELRNLFAHINNKKSIEAFLLDNKLANALQWDLMDVARENVLKPGLSTAKLFKQRLVTPHNDTKYEFTRKGIIFLICLALFKDEAFHFCSSLNDLKDMRKDAEWQRLRNDDAAEELKKYMTRNNYKNPSQTRAQVDMLTYFSMRSSYKAILGIGSDDQGSSVIDKEERDYKIFADIIGYLNKVPVECYDYLELADERRMLKELNDKSEESEENKEYKYDLKSNRRLKNRFLPLAIGYCEDFDLFPSIKFKRLDISEQIGRKRYCYGKENDNANGMDRHYAIHDGSVGFEYCPDNHYGDLRISSMRSSISTYELKRLLLLETVFRCDKKKIDEAISNYFSAYHRVMERMLNASDSGDFELEDFREDFSLVSGLEPEEISKDKLFEQMGLYFPDSLLRFFLNKDNNPTPKELKALLKKKIAYRQRQCEDFLNKIDEVYKRRTSTKEELSSAGKPVKISDGVLIRKVFNLLNIFLKPEEKFRQLPKSEWHKGNKDFEYQTLHAIIGKFPLDKNKRFWSFILECRPGLKDIIGKLQAKYNSEYERRGASEARRGLNALELLACAAVKCYRDRCDEIVGKLMFCENVDGYCKTFGVKKGMPLDRESLEKTILRIDREKWEKAFDYKNNKPYEGRFLNDVVVPQIPFPNGFAERMIVKNHLRNNKFDKYSKREGEKIVGFDFNMAFKDHIDGAVRLRNFYDVTPLLGYMNSAGFNGADSKLSGAAVGLNKESEADFSKKAISKTISRIKDVRNQDIILLNIALRYHHRDSKKSEPKGSIYKIYSNKEQIEVSGIKIEYTFNDSYRPYFSKVKKYAKQIAAVLSSNGGKNKFDYYDMAKVLNEQRSRDNRIRMEIIPMLNKMEEALSDKIPSSIYTKQVGESKEDRTQRIRKAEFDYYKKVYVGLEFEEYNDIVELRNAIFHDGFYLEDRADKVRNIFHKLHLSGAK